MHEEPAVGQLVLVRPRGPGHYEPWRLARYVAQLPDDEPHWVGRWQFDGELEAERAWGVDLWAPIAGVPDA